MATDDTSNAELIAGLLRPSLYEVLHRRFSVTQGLLSLAAGFGLIYAHASFFWFRHPAPLIGAVMLTVLVASINNNNWRRTLGSTFFAAAGGAIGMIDPRCMPGNVIFLALLGWIGFGTAAKLSDWRKRQPT